MTTRDLRHIDWANVAARARTQLGDERVEDFSQRLRTAMKVVEELPRPNDTVRLRFRELRPSGRRVNPITLPSERWQRGHGSFQFHSIRGLCVILWVVSLPTLLRC